MTAMFGDEPGAAFNSELYRAPQNAVPATFPTGVSGQTVPLNAVSVALALTTATIFQSSIILPANVPVSQLGVLVTTAGTATGYWIGLATLGGIIRAVSANSAGPAGTGEQNVSVLPSSGAPYRTEYGGIYYVVIGTVSSAAVSIGANAAAISAPAFAGPPIIAGTNATAATTTPPPVGTQLGALTGTTTALFYGQVY